MKNKANAIKKRKIFQRVVTITPTIMLLLIVFLIVSFINGGKSDKMSKELIGIWRYDQYTEYVFKDGGKGCICLDDDTRYEFEYTVNGDIIYIDFELSYVTDCRYTYTVRKNEMTLVGGEGTAQIGEVYKLTKAEG